MTAGKYLLLYLIALIIFLILDLIWLGVVARNFYRSQLGDLMREKPVWSVAFLFYALFIVGVLYFAVVPAISSGSWTRALLAGALFGFFTYATYDLTNLATLTGWPVPMVVVDIIWGTCLTASVAVLTYAGYRWWLAG